MEIMIADHNLVVETCRRFVPGARITSVSFDHVVCHGTAKLRVWWWEGFDESNWAYELFLDDAPEPEDTGPLETVEQLTIVLYEAFGPVVLPAVLVAMLAADAQPSEAPSIMEAARAVLREPKQGPLDKFEGWHSPNARRRKAVWTAAEARGLYCANTLMLAAATLVTPLELGFGWKRPVITAGPWDPEGDDLL